MTRWPASVSSRMPRGRGHTDSLSFTSLGIPTSTPGASSASRGIARDLRRRAVRFRLQRTERTQARDPCGREGRPAAMSRPTRSWRREPGPNARRRPCGWNGSTTSSMLAHRPSGSARVRAQNRCTYSSLEPTVGYTPPRNSIGRVPVAGLLEELARGGAEGVLAADVEDAGRDLDDHLADRRTELPHEQHVVVGRHREHGGGVEATDDLPLP